MHETFLDFMDLQSDILGHRNSDDWQNTVTVIFISPRYSLWCHVAMKLSIVLTYLGKIYIPKFVSDYILLPKML